MRSVNPGEGLSTRGNGVEKSLRRFAPYSSSCHPAASLPQKPTTDLGRQLNVSPLCPDRHEATVAAGDHRRKLVPRGRLIHPEVTGQEQITVRSHDAIED